MITREENRQLIARYPFLLPHYGRNIDGTPSRDFEYCFTELDFMPKGWRSRFGIEMCEEIREALLSSGKTYADGLSALNRYRIFWIKMENLRMQWDDTGEVKEIIEKYQDLSEHICCHCGKPATRISLRHMSPLCDKCGYRGDKYKPLNG